MFADGRPLTHKQFIALVRAALMSAGVDQERYCGHSFRIGLPRPRQAPGSKTASSRRWGDGRARYIYSTSGFQEAS